MCIISSNFSTFCLMELIDLASEAFNYFIKIAYILYLIGGLWLITYLGNEKKEEINILITAVV